MMTSRLITSLLRRRTPAIFSLHHSFSLLNPVSPPQPPPTSTASFRFFSSHSPDSDASTEFDSVFNHDMNSVTESELRNLGFIDGGDFSAAASVVVTDGGFLEDSIFPIRAIVSLLDGYHEISGLPWWIVIASSTVALRGMLLPLVILQLRKLKQIGEAFPKLPPPFPRPFSGKSYVDQFLLFRRERKALGCPSFLWFLASHTVQVPCFILLMLSIRRMSLAGFPGFDTGGILWFQDLTVSSNGVLGSVLPFLVAGLHFCNIQIAFRGSPISKEDAGVLQMLARWYRKYLEILTLPILFGGFYVPQGSLIYWVTNSSMTLVQQVCLQQPTIRERLGLVNKEASNALEESSKGANPTLDAPIKKKGVSAFDLSPIELVYLAVTYLSTNRSEKATPLLRLAVEKDPDCFRAWTVLGHVMMMTGHFIEATEYAECAISKIDLLGEAYNDEALDFHIQASLIAGGSLCRLGKEAEALPHFERVGEMKEPEDPTAKSRYYEGLMLYASFLASIGRKDEADEYVRRAAAFDPMYAEYLKLKDKNQDKDADFLGDLANSRRADY